MALTEHPARSAEPVTPFVPSEALAQVEVFMTYVQGALGFPGVREVRWVSDGGEADLYVMVDGVDSVAAESAHLLHRDLSRRYGRMPFALRVIDLGLLDEQDLPEGVTFSTGTRRAGP